MKVLLALGIIYGFGFALTFAGILYAAIQILVETPDKLIHIKPRKIITLLFATPFSWPIVLMRDGLYREWFLGISGIFIIIGYPACALFMLVYPPIWIWYLASCVGWYILSRYHEKHSKPQPQN